MRPNCGANRPLVVMRPDPGDYLFIVDLLTPGGVPLSYMADNYPKEMTSSQLHSYLSITHGLVDLAMATGENCAARISQTAGIAPGTSAMRKAPS